MATLQVKVTTQYYMTSAVRSTAAAAFAVSHKISEQTKFACHTDCNDPTQTIFFFVRLSGRMRLQEAMCRQICAARKEKEKKNSNICESTSGKKKREIFYFFVSRKTNTLDAHI